MINDRWSAAQHWLFVGMASVVALSGLRLALSGIAPEPLEDVPLFIGFWVLPLGGAYLAARWTPGAQWLRYLAGWVGFFVASLALGFAFPVMDPERSFSSAIYPFALTCLPLLIATVVVGLAELAWRLARRLSGARNAPAAAASPPRKEWPAPR